MVGVVGLEPTASCSQSTRASQLRHTPKYSLRSTSGQAPFSNGKFFLTPFDFGVNPVSTKSWLAQILDSTGLATYRRNEMTTGTWCRGADLNRRHEDFQSTALPLSYLGPILLATLEYRASPVLWRITNIIKIQIMACHEPDDHREEWFMVGPLGFEPRTPSLKGWRSNRLS